MKNTVLIDANVALDFLGDREASEIARDLFTRCAKQEFYGFIALHSISIIWYVLRKDTRRREYMKLLCSILTVAGASHESVLQAIDRTEFTDFEDCLQECCATNINADFIITRNLRDFRYSNIPAILPEDFIKLLNK